MPYPDPNKLQSPLARARGTGSSRTGATHWAMVHITSLALIPLCLWFLFSLIQIIGMGGTYDTALNWVKKPYHSFPLILFLGTMFYHAAITGQEILIDYIKSHTTQTFAVMAYKLFCHGLNVLSIFTVLYITFRI